MYERNQTSVGVLSMGKVTKAEKKKQKMRKKKQVNPLGRVAVELSGVKIEYDGRFIYLKDTVSLIEKIVQCARAELNDTQIITALRIRREDFLSEVEKQFKNSSNMNFLIGFLPEEVEEYSDMLKFWNNLKEEITQLLKEGKQVEEIAEQYGRVKEDIYRYISNEIGKIEEIKPVKVQDNIEVAKPVSKKINMKEYSQLFGFNGLHFDYTNIDNNIIKDIPVMSFDEFLKKYNYEGIQDIIYVRMQLIGVFKESRPFYPAEDAILLNYYPKVGVRVVEILQEAIPNYIIRDMQEYADRMKVLKNVKIHPKNSFGITKIDKKIIRLLCEKGLPLTNNKYMPWMTTADIQYYAYTLGYTTKKPLKEYDLLDVDNIDITPYVETAMNLKEVRFHSEKWTTTRHEMFKEGFKEKGIEIVEEIDWATKSECILRAKQFAIKQRYTPEEEEGIRTTFATEGWEGVKSKFSHRTEKALKYKLEEMGLTVTGQVGVSEEQLESLKAEMIDEIREEERASLRVEMKRELQREVEKELTPILEAKIRKNVEYTMRKELGPKLRESEISRISKEVDKFTNEILESTLRLAVVNAMGKIPPKDYGTRLVECLYDCIVDNVKSEIDKLKGK